MTAFIITLVILLAVFLFLIFPSARRHPDLEKMRGRYIAHRGYHNESAPENSIAAFKNAAEHGYIIENDIHLTKDGEIVVFHDDTTDRMCGVSGRIEDMTLSELKELSLGGTDEKIPTLKECLDAVGGRVPLLIEFKEAKDFSLLCSAADKILSEYGGEYFVQSFYPQAMQWYKKNRPDICRGQLASTFKKDKLIRRLLGLMLLNFISRPDFISYEHKYGNCFMLRLVCFLGAMPICWTIRSEEKLEKAKKYFKAYIFEKFEAK